MEFGWNGPHLSLNEKSGLLSNSTRHRDFHLTDPSVEFEHETTKVVEIGQNDALESHQAAGTADISGTRKITADDVLNFVGFGPFQVIALFPRISK